MNYIDTKEAVYLWRERGRKEEEREERRRRRGGNGEDSNS